MEGLQTTTVRRPLLREGVARRPTVAIFNVDDVSDVGGLAFGARGVPASETAGAIVIGMTTSAGGGGAAATPSGQCGRPNAKRGCRERLMRSGGRWDGGCMCTD